MCNCMSASMIFGMFVLTSLVQLSSSQNSNANDGFSKLDDWVVVGKRIYNIHDRSLAALAVLYREKHVSAQYMYNQHFNEGQFIVGVIQRNI